MGSVLFVVLACSTEPTAPQVAVPEPSAEPLDTVLSPEGFGPMRLGALGADLLAFEGARRERAAGQHAHDVVLEDAGLRAQVGKDKLICGIVVEDPKRYGLPRTLDEYVALYGAYTENPINGEFRFTGAPWLAADEVFLYPARKDKEAELVVSSLIIGGCA